MSIKAALLLGLLGLLAVAQATGPFGNIAMPVSQEVSSSAAARQLKAETALFAMSRELAGCKAGESCIKVTYYAEKDSTCSGSPKQPPTLVDAGKAKDGKEDYPGGCQKNEQSGNGNYYNEYCNAGNFVSITYNSKSDCTGSTSNKVVAEQGKCTNIILMGDNDGDGQLDKNTLAYYFKIDCDGYKDPRGKNGGCPSGYDQGVPHDTSESGAEFHNDFSSCCHKCSGGPDAGECDSMLTYIKKDGGGAGKGCYHECAMGWNEKFKDKMYDMFKCNSADKKEVEEALKDPRGENGGCPSGEHQCVPPTEAGAEQAGFKSGFTSSCHSCDGPPKTNDCKDMLTYIGTGACFDKCSLGWTSTHRQRVYEEYGCSQTEIDEANSKIDASEAKVKGNGHATTPSIALAAGVLALAAIHA